MNRVLLITLTVVMLALSAGFTALADGNSGVQACIASNSFPADVCSTCFNPAFESGQGDIAACLCKFTKLENPDSFQQAFGNFGGCVQFVHSTIGN